MTFIPTHPRVHPANRTVSRMCARTGYATDMLQTIMKAPAREQPLVLPTCPVSTPGKINSAWSGRDRCLQNRQNARTNICPSMRLEYHSRETSCKWPSARCAQQTPSSPGIGAGGVGGGHASEVCLLRYENVPPLHAVVLFFVLYFSASLFTTTQRGKEFLVCSERLCVCVCVCRLETLTKRTLPAGFGE